MPKPQELDRLRVIAEIARVATDVQDAYLARTIIGHDPRPSQARVEANHQMVADALANPGASAEQLYENQRARTGSVEPMSAWDVTFPITQTAHILFVATIRSLYPQ